MVSAIRIVPAILLCTFFASAPTAGQTARETARSSIGLRAGYAWDMGDWGQHRYATGVRLLKGSLAFDADMEFSVSERWTIGLNGGYVNLDGSEWENYAQRRGDKVTVSASLAYAGVMFSPFLKVSRPDIIKLEFGPGVLFASGSERFKGQVYSYDFIKSVKFGIMGGIEYDRLISDVVAVTVKVAGIAFPSGIEYADGENRTLTALPVTIGVRFIM